MKTGFIFGVVLGVTTLGAGCVERRLRVITSPEGAEVCLNDEQIGTSPVTVNFQWYGDYHVRITKPGYETLATHRALKAPWYDVFPFDLAAQVLWPGRIVDSYEWTFDLHPLQPMPREELIARSRALQEQMEIADP